MYSCCLLLLEARRRTCQSGRCASIPEDFRPGKLDRWFCCSAVSPSGSCKRTPLQAGRRAVSVSGLQEPLQVPHARCCALYTHKGPGRGLAAEGCTSVLSTHKYAEGAPVEVKSQFFHLAVNKAGQRQGGPHLRMLLPRLFPSAEVRDELGSACQLVLAASSRRRCKADSKGDKDVDALFAGCPRLELVGSS